MFPPWGSVMLGKVRVPWMTELLPGGLRWGGGCCQPPAWWGWDCTGGEGRGPGGCFCPCGPAGHSPHEASQPSHPRPHLEHPPPCADFARSHLVFQRWIVPSGTRPSWVVDCLLQFSEKKFLRCGAQFSFSANSLRSFSKLCFIVNGK